MLETTKSRRLFGGTLSGLLAVAIAALGVAATGVASDGGPEAAKSVAPTAQNGRIVFRVNNGADIDIYTMGPDGSNPDAAADRSDR